MNVFSRGMRNAFRNVIRTISIVIILGISVGLALSMLIARSAVQQKITAVKSSIGNTISVTPAGAQGFQGGGNPLTSTQVASIKSVSHVVSVASTLNDRLTASNTSLQSAIDAGQLGQRFGQNSGVGFQQSFSGSSARSSESQSSNGSTITQTFTPPVTVTAYDNLSSSSVYGGSSVKYTSGSAFDPTKDSAVAVIGKNLATKNNLKVNSTFTAYNTTFTVVGIYDAGSTFANDGMLIPLSTLQRLSNQTGDITSATVTVDSVDNLSSTVTAIKNKLGSSVADVTSDQATAETTVQPLENVKTISLYSLLGALAAGSIIILLTMMMIVRERRREIGVMKAIGSSNAKTMLQFITEAVTLTFIGLIIGIAFALVAATPITNALVTNSQSSSSQSTRPGAGGFGRDFRSLRSAGITNFRTVETSVGWNVIGYGIGAAFAIAIVGSAIPTYFISKIRPSEVMRAD